MTAGVVLAALLGRRNPAVAGHGWGVILQGAFLFFFDFFHAQSVPPPLPAPIQFFTGPEHQSFHWPSSTEGPGALLIHGFPGTPAEMQPVAELLHRQGWTVQAPLLPGFGPQIADIASYRRHDWLHAVESALGRMRSRHRPLLLLGYSMGGALAAAAAVAGRPDGLILLSPFWRLGSAPLRLAGRLLAPFLPRYFRPLQKADFSDPRLLESLREFLPGLDASDRQVQSQLRELQVPVSIIREIFACGRVAFARRRARCLDAETFYREVDGGHDILLPQSPGWAAVAEEVGRFAGALLKR